MLEILKTLCTLDGPSGNEDAVRDFIKAQAQPYAEHIEEDAMGNVLVFRKGSQGTGKTWMLAAHMDEVGLLIRQITEEGMLKFRFVGGVDARVVIGRRVRFGKVLGVVGIKAVHLTTADERKTMPKIDDLYIDIGAMTREEAEAKVSLGQYGVFDSDVVSFGDGMLKARALDDRVGCAILLDALKQQPKQDTWFCFTVQEEVGLRGATVAAFRVKPDFALVVEGTTAADLAEVPPHQSVCQLRHGAVLPFMDGRTIYDASLFHFLRTLAKEHQIPWQTKHMVAGGTDAGIIHQTGAGVKVAGIAVPIRYIHAPASVASVEDVQAVHQLVQVFLQETEKYHVENCDVL